MVSSFTNREQLCCKILLGSNNILYAFGSYHDTLILETSNGSLDTLTSNSITGELFMLKMDLQGNILQIIEMGITAGQTMLDIQKATIDHDNNIIVSGAIYDSVDLDLSTNTIYATTTSPNYATLYIWKMNSNGGYIWHQIIQGTSVLRGLATDNNNNILICGKMDYNVALAYPSYAVGYLASNNGQFLGKYDPNGNVLWATASSFTGIFLELQPSGLCISTNNNIYITGNREDLNGGSNPNEPYIEKYDQNGQLLWRNSYPNQPIYGMSNPIVEPNENLISIGRFEGTHDFDPGNGISSYTSNGDKDIFIQKIDAYGNFISVKTYGSPDIDYFSGISISKNNSLFLYGQFMDSIDFNIDTAATAVYTLIPQGVSDLYLLKLNQDSCSNLQLIVDSTKDVSCIDSGFIAVHTNYGTPPYSYSFNNAAFSPDSTFQAVSSGIYTVSVTDSNGCVASTAALINGVDNMTGYDFDINLTASQFRPGFINHSWITASNNSCDSIGGQIIVLIDSLMGYDTSLYDTSLIVPDTIIGDSLIWDFANLNNSTGSFYIHLISTLNSSAPLGEDVHMKVIILPDSGDLDTLNNRKPYDFEIIGSYDPNDIQVYPQGECDNHYSLENEELTYSIRFQNTGTAEAINVFIIDSIHPSLDINSLRIIGSSHQLMVTEILPGNVIKFKFDSIMLPDSTNNEPLSHGLVTFAITPLANQTGSIIENQAQIYFDYNLPVYTNSVFNTLTSSIPVDSSVYSATACDTFNWIDGNTYTSSNNAAFYTFENSFGCDSIVTLDLNILNSSYSVDSITACNGYTWLDGNSYSANNSTATYTTVNTFGCDSVITLNLTIHQEDSTVSTISGCDSIYWLDGNTYTSSNNTASVSLINQYGCDSLITLDLEILYSSFYTDSVTACDNYTWLDGNSYISNNTTATYITSNNVGCDSVITLNLTIQPSDSTIDSISSCDSLSWIDGDTYTSNNNSASVNFVNQFGCDSLVLLDLEILHSSSRIDSVTACDNYTWIDGATYTANTNTTFILSNQYGCDSIITLDLNLISNEVIVTSNSNQLISNFINEAQYQWIDCSTNTVITGEDSITFTPTQSGNYASIVTVDGCSDTSNCYYFTPTSVNTIDNAKASYNIYPNPTSKDFIIETDHFNTEFSVTIYSSVGQVIHQEVITQPKSSIQLDAPSGVYLIEISDDTGKNEMLKLIKQN